MIFVSVIGAAIALISLLASVNGGDSQQFICLLGACIGSSLSAGAIPVLIDIADRLDTGSEPVHLHATAKEVHAD